LRIERLSKEFGLALRWIAFPLHTDIPDEGIEVERLFPPGMYDFRMASERLERFATGEGIPWSPGEGMAYNSTRAQVLSKWAEAEGKGEAFHTAAFRAMFVERLNIAEPGVLRKTAQAAGLDPAAVDGALEKQLYTDAVNSDWEYCRKQGVTAVPTLSIGGRSLSGAHPYETMRELVTATGPGRTGGLNII